MGTVHMQGDQAVVEVDVYVTALPAQFFRFDAAVVPKDSSIKPPKVTFGTGSGSFSRYWSVMEPMLKLMADYMMTIHVTGAEGIHASQ